jgi:hypothetical protein
MTGILFLARNLRLVTAEQTGAVSWSSNQHQGLYFSGLFGYPHFPAATIRCQCANTCLGFVLLEQIDIAHLK